MKFNHVKLFGDSITCDFNIRSSSKKTNNITTKPRQNKITMLEDRQKFPTYIFHKNKVTYVI